MAGLSFTDITTSIGAASQTAETTLETDINQVNATAQPTTQDLMTMQQLMQQWSMTIELESTAIQTTASTMKGIIQKMS